MTTPARRHLPRRDHAVARRSRRPLRASAAVVVALAAVVAVTVIRVVGDDSRRQYLASDGWPTHGQAAYMIGPGAAHASPDQRSRPIASIAKVMTALLVLRAAPLSRDDDGFHLTVTPDDVADFRARADRNESVVPVRAGEVLSERQALMALLLPSANNIAIMLARRIGGTVLAFVARMNAVAARLGMTNTRYTDPSGFDDLTRSTAADQLVLAGQAMRNRTFATIVALRSVELPVAGAVHNTDFLLGTRGFVGIKTGSDDAAGGCFMFRTRRTVDGQAVDVTGVVLGQPGSNLVRTGQYAAVQLADHVAPAA